MVKIKVYARTRMNGSECVDYWEAPDDWEEMSEMEQERYLDECASEHRDNCVEFGAFAVEGDTE